MPVIWDPHKERTLRSGRGIALSEIADLLLAGKYQAIPENPSRPSQMVFIVPYHGYTHVVPFVIDNDGNIILKTAFPSRKFHVIYGEKP